MVEDPTTNGPGLSQGTPNGVPTSGASQAPGVPRRWIYWNGRPDWRKNARKHFGRVCEVCNVTGNYRGDLNIPQIGPDLAHLVAKVELEQYGELIGKPFLFDIVNLASLCQKCHSEFDDFIGISPFGGRRERFPRIEQYTRRYRRLFQRRALVLATLRSLAGGQDG